MSNAMIMNDPVLSAPELVKNAVLEAQSHTQTSWMMTLMSALSALSIAIQDKLRVKLPSGKIVPPTIFSIMIGESSERKSTTDGLMMKSIFDSDKSAGCDREAALKEFESALEIWEIKRDVLVESFQKAVKKGASTEPEELALHSHNKLKPVLPRTPKLIYSDATPEAIAWFLYTRWPSGALVSDEATAPRKQSL